MVRFTEPMLGNANLEATCKPAARRRADSPVLLDRVLLDPLLDGHNYIYMHYAT